MKPNKHLLLVLKLAVSGLLLTLLYLGVKDIRLGPSLPAFVTPNVLDVLVKNYGIKPITSADEDIKAILG